MSLKYEQYTALLRTQKLLYDLLDSRTRPKSVTDLKKRVHSCLRHFPFLTEKGEPIFSKDDFEQL